MRNMFQGKYDINNPIKKKDWSVTDFKTELFNPKSTPIEPLQHPYEFAMLLEEFKKINPKSVLEIGTCKGGTLWYWLHTLSINSLIISIDCFDTFIYDFDPNLDYEAMWKSWVPYGINYNFINGYSYDNKVINEVENILLPFIDKDKRCLDFLFIDVDHRYEFVKQDFNIYGPMVKKGGLIALHDINFDKTGLPQFWREICCAGYKTKVLKHYWMRLGEPLKPIN